MPGEVSLALKAGRVVGGLSKIGLGKLLMGTWLGSEVLNQLGQRGERGVMREQIAMQKLMQEAARVASQRAVEESKANTKEYTGALTTLRREERKQRMQELLMQDYMAGQNQQVGLLLQAMQNLSSGTLPNPTAAGGGMVGLMRSSF